MGWMVECGGVVVERVIGKVTGVAMAMSTMAGGFEEVEVVCSGG